MPDVGDWLEGHEGTLNNPLGEIHNGLMGQVGSGSGTGKMTP